MIVSKTRDNWIPEGCKLCKHFEIKARSGGRRWLGICKATGEQLVREDDGELKKSNYCPYMYSGVKHV